MGFFPSYFIYISNKYKNTTRYPIERYVGWTDTSSKLIFNISGVIPLLENHFLYLNILPRNLWIDICIYIKQLISNIKHQITMIS